MEISQLKSKLEMLEMSHPDIASAYPDDWNDWEASIMIRLEDNAKKRSLAFHIKKFFKDNFNATLSLKFNNDYDGYFFDFYYGDYDIVVPKIDNAPDAMIYSKKMENFGIYTGDKDFKDAVLRTFENANSQEHHVELLEAIYPDYTIIPLWTFEHGGVCLEYSPSCSFDSSSDAFGAYKNEDTFDNLFSSINNSAEAC
jgi:hypothetical protein